MRLTLAATALAALAFAGDALACSCVQPNPDRDLKAADGAFVGTLQERRSPTELVFDVERVVKGSIGPTVTVRSARNGAACGIETQEGVRIGLLLTIRNGEWHGGLCQQLDAVDLLAAAPGYAPIGTGEDTPWTAWVGSAAVGAVLFALALWVGIRRRRR